MFVITQSLFLNCCWKEWCMPWLEKSQFNIHVMHALQYNMYCPYSTICTVCLGSIVQSCNYYNANTSLSGQKIIIVLPKENDATSCWKKMLPWRLMHWLFSSQKLLTNPFVEEQKNFFLLRKRSFWQCPN